MDPFDPKAVRRTYDAVAEEYDTTFGGDLQDLAFDRHFLDDFAAQLAGPGPVIEVGCGPGQVAAYLAARGLQMIAVDLAPRMLRIARRRHRNVGVIAADFRWLPMRAGSCAGVVAFYSLPFLRRDELLETLRELRRVLIPGGALGLATHLGQGEIYGEAEWLGRYVDPIGVTLYQEGEIDEALAGASLRPDDARQRGPLSHEHQGPRIYIRATAVGDGMLGPS